MPERVCSHGSGKKRCQCSCWETRQLIHPTNEWAISPAVTGFKKVMTVCFFFCTQILVVWEAAPCYVCLLKYLFLWPGDQQGERRELWDRWGRRAEAQGAVMRLRFHSYQGTATGRTAFVSERECVWREELCRCECECDTKRAREGRFSWWQSDTEIGGGVCTRECVYVLVLQINAMK